MADQDEAAVFNVDMHKLQTVAVSGILMEWSAEAVHALREIGMPYTDATYTPTNSWQVAEDIGRLFYQQGRELEMVYRFCEDFAPWATIRANRGWLQGLADTYGLAPKLSAPPDRDEEQIKA